MARLPDSEVLGGLPSVRSGRQIARYDTSAEWAGLADLGEGAERLGASVQAAWGRVSAEETQSKYDQFEFDELKRYDEAVQNIQPGQAKGFTDGYLKSYFDRAKKFQESVDGQYRGQTEEKLFSLEKRLWGDAIGFERGEVKRSSLNNLDSTFRSVILPFAAQAAALPTGDLRKGKLLAEAESKARKLIDENAALTPIERDELWNGATDDKGNWKPGVRENIQKAFLGSLPDEEQLYADPTRPVETLGSRIRQVESGGDATAENPNSSALGADGFLDGTWLGLMEKYHPELTKGKSKSQILSLRTDEQLSGEMRDLYATENSQFLGSRGYAASPGNIYLAHFLGPAGAVQMLGADPNTPADEINPKAAAANANVFYVNGNLNQPRTAGEIAEWANGLMSGVRHEDWATTLDAVPFDYKVAAAQDAGARLVKSEADRRKADEDARTAVVEDRKFRIESGQPYGEADLQGDIESGLLTDGDDIHLLRERIQQRDKDAMNYAGAVKRLVDPNDRFNGFSDDDKKAVDLVYDKGPTQGGKDLLGEGNEQAVQDLRAIIQRTDIVPSSAKDMLQSGIWSRAGEERDNAFSILDGLYRENPALIGRVFSEQDIKRLQDYQQLAPLLPPEELEQRLNPNLNPQEEERRKTLRLAGEKLARDIGTDDLLSAFDPSYMPFDQPSSPRDPMALASLRADFEALYAERYAVTGQEDAAKTQALERLRDKWGPTEVGSESTLMAYPPELNYPMVDGSHDWMDDQLADFIEDNEPDAQEWFLIPSEETQRVIASNRANDVAEPVPYTIGIVDNDGIFRVLSRDDSALPRHFTFNYDEAREGSIQRFNEERQDLIAPPVQQQEPVPVPEGYTMPFKPEPGPGPTLQ